MSLKELRELTRSLDTKKKEFQELQSELKLKDQFRLYAQASKNKKKLRETLKSSPRSHLENFFSRIRFDYLGLSLLIAIIAAGYFYLHSNGIISSPLQRGKYQVTVSAEEDKNRSIAEAVQNLMQEVKSREQPPSLALAKLFNTGNQEKINRFISETDSLNLKSIVYVKNENCYYASALTDKDRNITFRLNQLSGEYKISSIDIED
jgi:hypothetical protein